MNEPSFPPAASAPAALALVRDLLFASKITGTAQALGIHVKIVRDPAKLAGERAGLLLVDLNQPGAIEAATGWAGKTGGRTIGFVSHVDTDTVATARAAGIDQVMARGRFVQMLADLLQEAAP